MAGSAPAISRVVRLRPLASLGGRHYLAVRSDGTLARADATKGVQVWRINAKGIGKVTDAQLDPERQQVLLMGSRAWRLFRLADGFPLSALLIPPPALDQPDELGRCTLSGAIGTEGQLLARCASGTFAWRPQEYEGEPASRIALVSCASDVKAAALDNIRRCFVGH